MLKSDIERIIIDIGLGQNGLPVLARQGEDPGREYFNNLTKNLKQLCILSKGDVFLNKELSYALFCIGHYPEIEYPMWIANGRKFREDLYDPQILELNMAVESVLSGTWIPFLEE